MSSNRQSTAALSSPALKEADVIGSTISSIPPGLFSMVILPATGPLNSTSQIARGLGVTVVSKPERGHGAASLGAFTGLSDHITGVAFMHAEASWHPPLAVELLAPIL